jgi:polyhydroxybutyrate depolymerase
LTKIFNRSWLLRAAAGAALVGVYTMAGCSSEDPGDTPLSGSAGLAGMSTSSGGSGVAGNSSAGTNSAGTGGSSAGRGGNTSQAGQTQSEAGKAGAGGVAAGGTSAVGGMSGGGGGSAGGSTGGKPAADPSTGCTNTKSPPSSSSGSPLTVSGHQYYVKLPTGYDATKPYPVMMMFNPTGNPISWAEQNAGFEAAGPKAAWIRVYPTMAKNDSGWGAGDVAFFQPFYDEVLATYCVDKARVFAAGESSGGDFVSILGCEYGDKIRFAAPCATKPVNGYDISVPVKRQCKGEVTAIVIHGKNDNQVGPENGPKTRDFYAALNGCDTATMPTKVMGYDDTLSNCVMYQGCDAGFPVYWCQHTDPNYSNTNHGWPAFAPKFLWELLSAY